MAKKKQASTPVRVRDQLYAIIETLAEARATTPTEIVNQYVRAGLEREGLWPTVKRGSKARKR